ncbi:class I SAM-dependent methyltransferase [Sinimarinibacterium sp. HSW-8]|uniref:Class I SAM-dependent methyltransferase n=1 Tax=Sinimarinibacterium thermocellulolyticum TaxID=3170016 RepID=A0ABV2AE06_9GAMM
MSGDDRVVELGCGNGSLIRWFAQAARCWPQAIDAVDLAELDDTWLAQLPAGLRQRVRLHPRTPATGLPAADASINQLWSQYALEYFADEDGWAFLRRVLAPRATLAAIVHHRASLPARVADAERVDAEWLLRADGPLDQAATVLPWLAMSEDPARRTQRDADPHAAAARQRFNAAFAEVAERIEATAFPDLLRDTAERVMRILRTASAGHVRQATSALQALRADLADNQLRVAELVDCALDRDGIQAWAQRLGQMGFTAVDIGEIQEQGQLFGWRLVARRGAVQGET